MLGLRLDHGGHLTHGLKVNFSGRLYDVHPYGVRREDSLIDFDEVRRLAQEERPKLIVAGASAYPRVIDAARFRAIADEVGALLMVDMAHFAGLVAAGPAPEPGRARRRGHVDDAQDARRAARRAWCCAARSTPRRSTRRCSRGSRAGRCATSSRPRRCASSSPQTEAFRAYQRQIVANAEGAGGRR